MPEKILLKGLKAYPPHPNHQHTVGITHLSLGGREREGRKRDTRSDESYLGGLDLPPEQAPPLAVVGKSRQGPARFLTIW